MIETNLAMVMVRVLVDSVPAHLDTKAMGVVLSRRAPIRAAIMVSVTWANVYVNHRTPVMHVNFHRVAAIKFVKTMVFVVKVRAFAQVGTPVTCANGWYLGLGRPPRAVLPKRNALLMKVALNVVAMALAPKAVKNANVKQIGRVRRVTYLRWMM